MGQQNRCELLIMVCSATAMDAEVRLVVYFSFLDKMNENLLTFLFGHLNPATIIM